MDLFIVSVIVVHILYLFIVMIFITHSIRLLVSRAHHVILLSIFDNNDVDK